MSILLKKKAWIWPFIGGILYALGFPTEWSTTLVVTPVLGMALFLSHLPILKEKAEVSLTANMAVILSFCLGFYLMGYYWIPYTLSEFGQIPVPLNYLLGLLFPLIIAPHFYVYYFLLRGFSRFFPAIIPPRSHLAYGVVMAGLLTMVEYFTPQQFPGHMGHSWFFFKPYLYLATILGVPLFSFLSFWMTFSLMDYWRTKKINYVCLAAVFVAIVLNVTLTLTINQKTEEKSLNLRLVQPNVGNYIKVSAEQGVLSAMREVVDFHYDESVKSSQVALDLIIWPETAYPRGLNSKWAKIHPESVPEVIKQVVGQTGAELFFGGYDKITDDLFSDFETTANTTFLVGQNFLVKDFYHKIKLIPFGETLPFGFFNQYLSRWVTNISFFASGDRETVFKTKNDFYFISPICYEILFSQFMRRFYQNNELYLPHFMINVTNDSWYRMPEQVQHKFLAHWRAIEFGIPIIRATNTGITSILYPDGKESEQIGIGLRTSKDFQFTFKANPSKTFFVSWGIYGFIIFWLVLILVIYFWKNLLSTNRAS